MFSKPTTLLLISRQTLARVDIAPSAKPKIVSHWQRARFESESIATLVDATCRLGKRKPGKVVVLCDQFWMGVAALPDEIASSLGGEELLQSIALECETYSGISAFESRAVNVPLDQDRSGERRWLVTQIANADIRACVESVEHCGGSLVGLAHPANPFFFEPTASRLPKRSSSSSDASWRSVQVWGSTVSMIRGRGNRLQDALVQDGNLSQPRMLETVQAFLDGAASPAADQYSPFFASEEIADEDAQPSAAAACWVNQAIPGVDADSVIDTREEGGLLTWATAWGRQLAAPADSSGLVRLPKRPMSRERSIALAVVGGLVVLIGCAAHHRYLSHEIQTIEENNRLLTERKKQIADDKKSADALEKTLAASRDKLTALTSANTRLKQNIAAAEELHLRQQARWITLIDAVANSHQPNIWIQRMAATDQTVVIHGYAVDTASALQLTSTLDQLVSEAGWRAAPAETHPENGKLVSFTFALTTTTATDRPASGSGNLVTTPASGSSPSDGATLHRAVNTGTGTRASRRRAQRENAAESTTATGG